MTGGGTAGLSGVAVSVDVGVSSLVSEAAESGRPNILFITVDDMNRLLDHYRPSGPGVCRNTLNGVLGADDGS